jgi:uncharacterized ferritin-like protein (DUF455 family)
VSNLQPPPPPATIERWAWDYVMTTSLAAKLQPATPPPAVDSCVKQPEVPEVHTMRGVRGVPGVPGRPSELHLTERADKTRGLGAPSGRARALHTFLHHELQAAELMAWAILAFPDTPAEFRDGLARITLDEARHMRLYAEQIERLGHRVGEFPVRDWFWTRVPACRDPASFVAVMGLGLESANLEHTAKFAAQFREAGDEEGARVQEVIGLEEIAHVRFGVRWFERFTQSAGGPPSPLDFETWKRALPAPLSPLLMRGRPFRRDVRIKAGQPASFLDELEAWQPE